MAQINYSSPKIWGPSYWLIMRTIAHTYPINPNKDDAAHVKTFFNELQYVLPCEICKYTFKQHFNKYPLEKNLGNRNKLIEWVELIYQETKKVIQDRRIKIMDTPEEEPEEMAPVRTIFKSKNFDPVATRLNELNNNKNALPKTIPTQSVAVQPAPIEQQPKIVPKDIYVTEHPKDSVLEKKNIGKKMPIPTLSDKTPKTPFVFPPKIQKSAETEKPKINNNASPYVFPIKLQQSDKPKEIIKEQNIEINKQINKQIPAPFNFPQDKTKLEPIKNIPKNRMLDQDWETKSMPPKSNKPNLQNPYLSNPTLKPMVKYNPQQQHKMPANQMGIRELVLTRRCKKCDEKELKKI